MVTSLGVMRIFPIQIITEEGRIIKGLCSSPVSGDYPQVSVSVRSSGFSHAQQDG
jgi:hypothetical protein